MSITFPQGPSGLAHPGMAGLEGALRWARGKGGEPEPWLPAWCQQRGASFWLWFNGGVALGYLLLGWAVGRFFAAYGLFPAPIWLPAGLAATAAMLGGWRLVPGIFLGSFLVNAGVFHAAPVVAAAISIGNAMGPLCGALLTRRLRPESGLFTRFRGVVAFILGAVLLHALVTATVGTLSLMALGGLPLHAASGTWGAWLLCDAGGTFYFAPSLALWLKVESTPSAPGSTTRPRHATLLDGTVWLGTALLAAVLFSVHLPPGLPASQLIFLLAVPLSWIALRISLRAAYTLLTLLCIIASAGTVAGFGPFQGGASANPMQSASMLVVMCGMNILTLLALVSERREAEWGLAEVNYRLEQRVHERTEQLQWQAETDALTGIANRRGFMRSAEAALGASQGLGQPMGLITFDIDHFKAINDCAGHAGGDAVLRLIAESCQPLLRRGDLFGRLGGEEFAIALPGQGGDAVLPIAERLRAALKAVRPDVPLPTAELTASFGIAVSRPEETLSQLLLRADNALYAAKNAGRDQVQEAV
jgi:diguanylate cyclase (GGDEF)-like protein